MNLKARLLAAAVSLVALALPGPALAAHHRSKAHAEAPSFPMKADEYRKLADKRIEKVWSVVEKKLERRGVSADRKKAMRKTFDEVARETRAEVARAAADGTVTEAEANRVKKLSLGLRGKLRERLAAEKSGKAAAPKGDTKSAKSEPKGAKADAKGAKIDAKGAKVDTKPAKAAAGRTKPAKKPAAKPKKAGQTDA
jgi:hypothetical protein